MIISVLHHAFPGDVFIAEESGEMLRGESEEIKGLRERVWELVGGVTGLMGKVGESNGDMESVDVKLPATIEEMIDIIDLGQIGGRPNTTASTGRTWILDPIDGTKTYIRGQQYVVCLCLVEHGEQQVAVFGCPNLSIEERDDDERVRIEERLVDLRGDGGWIVSCTKGEGVTLARMETPWEGRGLGEVVRWNGAIREGGEKVDGIMDNDKESSPVCIRFTDSAASPHISKPLHQKIFDHFSPTPNSLPTTPLDIWSMQLKYVLLTLRASGADAMIRTPPNAGYHASVWDHAGGQLLLRESGGVLTDAEGKVFVLDGGMRRLEGNWGVCAVRGGKWVGRRGGMEGGEVHRVLRGWVGKVVEEREQERREGKDGQ